MALFPFSIADIDDPECIRVVLYASGRMGHAPLNALLKKAYEDMTKISERMDALEKKLKTLDLDNFKQKKNAKEDDQSIMSSSIVSGGITVPNTQMNIPEIKLEPSVDKRNFFLEFTSLKTPEIHNCADDNITLGSFKGSSSFVKKEK
ncbi:hypothetical protein D1093_09125 [Bartonella kosoyi]|uniref:Uncharacterized protein n=1 Tax=Bartonella kosoyi TaxID=2133959 RepID=A0A5B9CYF6_9HYPH|nr:hypothetical protein [Bartonella kosoyi]QEE09729.1 hypothetical protein D1093_09125 [Bartonella kosoyi]